jgi:hypothetical protein
MDHESQLASNLRACIPVARAAFATACAERAQGPLLSRGDQVGEIAELRASLDVAWATLASGGRPNSRLAADASRWELSVPHEDDVADEEALFATNATTAVVYALQCIQDGDLERAVWAARKPIEILDLYLTRRLDFDPNRSGDETMVRSHPLMQAEFARQRRDVAEVARVRWNLSEEILEPLQQRARAEAETLLPDRRAQSLHPQAGAAVEPLISTDAEVLSRAIVVWLGRGYSRSPQRSEVRLVEEFGYDRAHALIKRLEQIWDVFYASNACDIAPDLMTMGDLAIDHYRKRGPTKLSDDALEALAWSYTFDHK